MPSPKPDIKILFDQAVEIESAAERRAFLDAACAGDAEARRMVDELLAADEQASQFLESPAVSPPDLGSDQATVALTPPSLVGTTIAGRYKLLELIEEGGMGTVFKAQQSTPMKRTVALKLIRAGMDSRQFLARFDAERQALALMDHPNIAKVFDAGATEGGHPYFVMEFVQGVPLTQYCDERQLSVGDRLQIFQQICQAVQHAHQKGIIHRDLKPSNILIESHDGRPTAKVIDFGLAKAINSLSLTDLSLFTNFGSIVGTPMYMAPEQAEISAIDVDTRADIYALGVILYELLTGSTPLEKNRLVKVVWDEIRRAIKEEEPAVPSSRLSTTEARASIAAMRHTEPAKLSKIVRGDLDWIVMKALAKERDRRYETANAFAADVQRFLSDEPVLAGPPTVRYKLRKFLRRNRRPAAVGMALLALLLLGIAGTSIGLARSLRAERDARDAADAANIAKGDAKDEAAVARAVNAFLQEDLLAEAAPDRNPRNKKVTVEELLGRAASRIAGRFAEQPRVEAAIRQTIGEAYTALGDYRTAETHIKRALELRRQVFGDEHRDTLTSTSHLGLLYKEQNRLAEAEPLLSAAREIGRRVAGEEDPETLTFSNNRAILHIAQGEYDKAEALLSQVLEARLRVLPKDHPHTLTTMGNLGLVQQARGKHQPSEGHLSEALAGFKRIHGNARHPETLVGMNNLATHFQSREEFKNALPLFEEVLKARREVLTVEHPHTLAAMNNLGMVYLSLRRPGDAEKLLKEALAASPAIRPDDDPETIQLVHNLGLVYHTVGRLEAAAEHLERAAQGRRRVLSPGNPHTSSTIAGLSIVYARKRRFADAERILKEALALAERARPKDEPDTLLLANNLGYVYHLQERFADAQPYYERSLSGRRKVLGPAHSYTLGTADNLAEVHKSQGRLDKAEEIYREVVAVQRSQSPGGATPQLAGALATLGLNLLQQRKFAEAKVVLEESLAFREANQPDHWSTFNTKSALGGALAELKEYAKAEALLLAGHEGLRKRVEDIPAPVRPVRLREAIERLVQLYTAWEKPVEAAKWRVMLPPPIEKGPLPREQK